MKSDIMVCTLVDGIGDAVASVIRSIPTEIINYSLSQHQQPGSGINIVESRYGYLLDSDRHE
jgi:hypothetical protein